MHVPEIKVVVFDFNGVCTPSHHEFMSDDAGPIALLRPGLAAVIDEVQRRGLMSVLSSSEFDREWLSTIEGFPVFDHVLLGTDNGICKPDRRAFQRVALVTGYSPDECLIVDDDETNLTSAQSIGYKGVLFDTADPAGSWERVLEDCRPQGE